MSIHLTSIYFCACIEHVFRYVVNDERHNVFLFLVILRADDVHVFPNSDVMTEHISLRQSVKVKVRKKRSVLIVGLV